MNKLLLTLLMAATSTLLSAQPIEHLYAPAASENIFNSPPPGNLPVHFDFLLPNNNRMVIELRRPGQLAHLPNPDSLFRKVWADLEALKDSLSDPLSVKRVDYIVSSSDTKIRIKHYSAPGSYFSYRDDELVQLKVDQDTLRYKGITAIPGITDRGINVGDPFVIILLLNNITDVEKLSPGALQSGMDMVKKDVKEANEKTATYHYGVYDLRSNRRISPVKINRMSYGNRHGFEPYIHVGIQYGRNSWIPTAGAGIEYYYGQTRYSKYAFRLIWEPYFFFQRNNSNKLVTERQDFITLRFHNSYTHTVRSGRNTIEMNENFSFGYLIRRKGEWFEPTTFKFALPGLQVRNILAEPEFFFNKFFRNFSPSLRLLVYFE